MLTREEEVDGVEHVVDNTSGLWLQLRLGCVGDEICEYEQRNERLELPGLIQSLNSVSQASDQARISAPRCDFCRFRCFSNGIHPRKPFLW